MKALICGGRDFNDRDRLYDFLESVTPGITKVIHGAQRGADTLAGQWADHWKIPCTSFPADWNKYHVPGRKNPAGAIRNRQMLVEGKPDVVIAFPGGPGTANMVAQARKAGVKVIEVS